MAPAPDDDRSPDEQRTTSRRQFLRDAGLTAGALGMYAAPGAAAASRARQGAARRGETRRARRIRTSVAILGGGMGGLAAAHELADRGFKVTVVEPKALGGKARSIPFAGTGTSGRADLPGEHGFRFFPGFYKNVPDTMSRIPYPGNSNGVLGNLVDAGQELLIFDGNKRFWSAPTQRYAPQDYQSPTQNGIIQAVETAVTLMGIGAGVPANEIEYFVRRLEVFFTSSDERRLGEWENTSWWDFTNAASFSPEYQRAFGTGLTKDLVAAKGRKASARTVGLMAEAFVYAVMADQNPQIRAESGYGAADRLLNAPTNEAWIDPWIKHLRSLGVRFLTGYRAAALQTRGGRVLSAGLQDVADDRPSRRRDGDDPQLEADWFICAMPIEQCLPLLDKRLLAADPSLARLRNLETDWMNGIQYFLNRPPGLQVKGHVAFLESPWALTSIDQGLFWNRDISKEYGNGKVTDIYSVDISDFFTPGIVYGKPASQCTPEQIAREAWEQMKQELNTSGQTVLSDDMLVTWFLDPAIHYPQGRGRPAANSDPLLINTAGSLADRPNSHTEIPNLFLAADYVRMNVDLATMEGANEAGRQAANALLHASGSTASPAKIGTLWQPRELDPVRNLDARRYRAGQPNLLDSLPTGGKL
jgi:uncharacterized protein with NAD-binding domain and iron-sulfur cluster